MCNLQVLTNERNKHCYDYMSSFIDEIGNTLGGSTNDNERLLQGFHIKENQ